MNLVGLAFSGGGIRSATFNLGVLQALAKLDVLRHCDYLSTVSGGGYIGSWFTAWTYREGKNMNGGERVQETLEVREARQVLETQDLMRTQGRPQEE
ncbi:MAG: patatin-like phospholipase family protein [Nitrospiraceae bacterium]|nr:patatin-like phospholipase family protein [Nitrospiraceae bacterium]